MTFDATLHPSDLLLLALLLVSFLTWREMTLVRRGKSRLRDVWAEYFDAVGRQKQKRVVRRRAQ